MSTTCAGLRPCGRRMPADHSPAPRALPTADSNIQVRCDQGISDARHCCVPFVSVGTLGGMVSAAFNAATIEQGKIMRLTSLVEPSELGCGIDDEYRGEKLPLWIVRTMPDATQ